MNWFFLGLMIVMAFPFYSQAELKVGDPAPEFTLPDMDGKDHALSSYKGKIVAVYFYPKNDTPGCTKEACNLRDNDAALRDAGVVVLGVSYDSPDSHKAFKAKHNLPFTLLSDSKKDVSKLYGANGMLMPKRMTFLIDAEGKIMHIFTSVKTDEHAAQILEVLPKKTIESGHE